MWPAGWWLRYEHLIRRAAGLGTAPTEDEEAAYDRRYAHCDVLVVGGGPAGLSAAQAGARAGARVVVADEQPEWGGSLLGRRVPIGDRDALEWVDRTVVELAARPNVTLLVRATVFGRFDQNLFGIAVRQPDGPGDAAVARQTVWQVRARQAVVATGAIERPIVFAGNDRPGVMLAGAAQAYANRYGVRAGRRAVVFTNNDSAYQVARDLGAAGIAVAAVVDARATPTREARRAEREGLPCQVGHTVMAARGRGRVRGALVAPLDAAGGMPAGRGGEIACDLLCVAGGWSPTAHLYSQIGGKLAYDEGMAALKPSAPNPGLHVAGTAAGEVTTAACLRSGQAAGAAAARAAGHAARGRAKSPRAPEEPYDAPRPLWIVPPPGARAGKRFVDLQNDVTLDVLALAVREGYVSVEHLKRYTTLGMGTDQGKTSNVNAIAALAGALGSGMDDVGTTRFRPPYTPVTLGALAARDSGRHFAPIRRTPMQEWHAGAGAVFVDVGLWQRPYCYPRPGEGTAEAVRREARAVRERVGIVDVSTLGRIDVQGPDAAGLLDRLYINAWANLAVGRIRYGVMLREDGMVFDDGTAARLADTHFVITTTTTNAEHVLCHIEYHLQVVWPELDAHVTAVTEQYAVMAVAGPRARAVLQRLEGDIDFDNEALPFMGWSAGTIAGVPATVYRISFSGELSYEIAVPADYGRTLWERLLEAGAAFGIAPYGTEAMNTLRIEKGRFVIDAEADGRVTAADLGLERMQSTAKDYVGRRSLSLPGLAAAGRRRLVGLLSTDGVSAIPAGAQIVAGPQAPPPVAMEGHVTSAVFSPNLGRPIALAMVRDGHGRKGERLYAVAPLTGEAVEVELTGHVFIDPEGARLHA